MSFSRHLRRRTAMKKSERKGRRSFDTAIEYGTVAMVAREKTRTAKAAVRATCSIGPDPNEIVPLKLKSFAAFFEFFERPFPDRRDYLVPTLDTGRGVPGNLPLYRS